MYGEMLSAATQVGGAALEIMNRSKVMNKYKKNVEQQLQDIKNIRNRRYNEDATQRADAQRILTMTADAIKNRNRAAAGTQAVMGGTDESVAAEKAANNQAMAEAASMIVAAGNARKDKIEDAFGISEASYQNQLNNMELQKADNVSKAISGVTSAVGALGESIDAPQSV